MGKKKKEEEGNKSLENKLKIMEMETKKREEKQSFVKEEAEIDFDSWFYAKSKSIPSSHLKEIVWADFKARGLKKRELVSKYDEALKKYGI